MIKVMWKCLPGYDKTHAVSNTGKVKSLARKNNRGVYLKETVLKPHINRGGYERVVLCVNGKRKTMSVHRLVALVFVVGYNEDLVVNHIDFNPSNNNPNNLEWVTQKENVRYSAHRMNLPNLKNSPEAV